MRILVTGGAGFIGSHLIDALIARGDDVVCLDNLFTGSSANVAHLMNHPRFHYRVADVCEPFYHEVDQLYHLACPASPLHYQRNPYRTIQTAVFGTINALKLARDTGARMLIASTSEVYGDPDVHPQPESYVGRVNPVGPRACYDEGKRCAESLAASWALQYSTDVRIARIFNTYGPRMATGDGRLIPNLITQALAGEPLTIYGDGSQTRSLCYVSDTVRGLMALMDDPKAGYLPVNIGNPDERTILNIAKHVSTMCERQWYVDLRPLPEDDPRQRCPDITVARQMLGWEPKTEFGDGLYLTVEWFRQVRRAA